MTEKDRPPTVTTTPAAPLTKAGWSDASGRENVSARHAAARRVGRRGDGYFPGGALDQNERAIQMELARSTAAEAGRSPETLEYTRWGSISMTVEQVEAFAAQGVTRVVVSPTTAEPGGQHDEMSAFAERFALL